VQNQHFFLLVAQLHDKEQKILRHYLEWALVILLKQEAMRVHPNIDKIRNQQVCGK
jgi:hypothetical protein